MCCGERRLTALVAVFALALTAMAGVGGAAEGDDMDAALEQRHRLVGLARGEGAGAIPALAEALGDDREVVRYTAAHLLASLGDDAREALADNLGHEDTQVRLVLIKALERIGAVHRHVETLAQDEDAAVRRYFYLHVMPAHLLEDGEPTDDLIAAFDAVYADAGDRVRREIVEAVAELPLTEPSVALLRKAADLDKAVAAVDDDDAGEAEEKALIAQRVLLEMDIERMGALADAGEWRQLAEEFGDEDIAAWPDTHRRMMPGGWLANEAAEARYWLGRAYCELGEGDKAEAELKRAMARGPSLAHARERNFYSGVLMLLGQNYQDNLAHRDDAGETHAAQLLDHAKRLEDRRPQEALAMYRRALEVEGIAAEQKRAVQEAIAELE